MLTPDLHPPRLPTDYLPPTCRWCSRMEHAFRKCEWPVPHCNSGDCGTCIWLGQHSLTCRDSCVTREEYAMGIFDIGNRAAAFGRGRGLFSSSMVSFVKQHFELQIADPNVGYNAVIATPQGGPAAGIAFASSSTAQTRPATSTRAPTSSMPQNPSSSAPQRQLSQSPTQQLDTSNLDPQLLAEDEDMNDVVLNAAGLAAELEGLETASPKPTGSASSKPSASSEPSVTRPARQRDGRRAQ